MGNWKLGRRKKQIHRTVRDGEEYIVHRTHDGAEYLTAFGMTGLRKLEIRNVAEGVEDGGDFLCSRDIPWATIEAMGVPPSARRPRPKAPIPGVVYKIVVLAVLILLFWWLFQKYISGGRPAQYPAAYVAAEIGN